MADVLASLDGSTIANNIIDIFVRIMYVTNVHVNNIIHIKDLTGIPTTNLLRNYVRNKIN